MTPARERLLVVLALVALGGLAVLASTRDFVVVDLAVTGRALAVPGSQAAPALAPIGIAQLALAGALTISGRVARTVLGALLLLLGLATVALLLPVLADPAAGAAGAVAAATGTTDDAASAGRLTGTAWPAVALVGGVASGLTGLLVLVRGPRWSTGGRRFRPEGAAPVRAADPVSEWDALTRGGDPTDGTGGPDPEGRAP